MKSRLSSDIMLYSMVYGQGLRFLVLTQQCVHNCMIFHNSQIYNLYNVYEADRTDIIEKIKHLELERCVDLSGEGIRRNYERSKKI